jgi:hypothetical protein
MRLGEALALRADLTRQLDGLRDRARNAARHQQGEDPPEDPVALLAEADWVADRLEQLIRQINRTNIQVRVQGDTTLTDLLAERDVLAMRRRLLDDVAHAAVERSDRSWGRAELRFTSAIDVPALRARLDALAAEHRRLDTRIQALNWAEDLLEQ